MITLPRKPVVFIFLFFFVLWGHSLQAQLRVNGRYLYDQCGEKIVLRGVNEMFIYSPDRTGAVTYPEIAKTGANSVRFMWRTDPTVPISAFAENIRNCVANKMIPIPGLWDATGKWGTDIENCIQWWLKPEVVAICKNNPYMIVNIANEAGNAQMADYTTVYSSAVQRLRNAGITNVIMIDADRWGRSWETIRDKAIAIRDADPQKNVLFAWHTWDTNMDYSAPIRTIAQKDICLVIGEFSHRTVGCGCCIDYKQIMAESQAQSVGYLAWSWGLIKNSDCTDGSMDMTTNGTFAGLKAGWPTEVAITDPNSIKNISVRPYSILNSGTCRPSSGTNVALNKPAFSSTIESSSLAASNAFDGNAGTRWSSTHTDPQWIYVDLGANYSLSKVILRWEAAYGRGYQIQTSTNASTWTTVYSTTAGDGGVDEISLSNASGRYVRMSGTARGTTWGYSLWEFEVYGTASGGGTTSTATLNPIADTDSQSDRSEGTNPSLNASKFCHMFSKFSLTGIGTISSAKLRYYKHNTNTGTLTVHTTNTDNWTEGGAKPVVGSVVASVAMGNTASYIEIDVTSMVRTEAAGDKVVSFGVTTDLNTWTGFNSRENATNKPQLVIIHGTTATASAQRLSLKATEQPRMLKDFSISPNPANDKVEINFYDEKGEQVQYQLLNSGGQVMFRSTQLSVTGSNRKTISTSALKPGLYFIQLEKGGKRMIKKIMISR